MSRGLTTAKQIGTKIAKSPAGRIISRAAGPVAWGLTAYDVGKTAKETIPGLKKRAKSGNVNLGRKL